MCVLKSDHHHNHLVKHEVREISPILEYIIIGLACANFLIPTINLYHLSQLSACRDDACKKIKLKGKLRHILIHFIRLISVNIAYLVIRVYVSQNYDKAITIFIIKNALCIIMSSRSLFIEINEYFSTSKQLQQDGSRNGLDKRNGDSSYGHSHAYELQNLASNVNDKLAQNGSKSALADKDIANVDNFEDVSLK